MAIRIEIEAPAQLASELLAERTVRGRVRWCGVDPAVPPALAVRVSAGERSARAYLAIP
jgi:hypothetical protein